MSRAGTGDPGGSRTATGRPGAVAPSGPPAFEDDFRDGLATEGPDSRWELRPLGGRPGGDGVAAATPEGLVVAPPGRSTATGDPAFAPADGPGPDLRWAALAARASSRGYPGFGAEGGLVIAADLAAEGFGLDLALARPGTPPERDTRLAAAGLLTLDRETGVVFDVLLTHRAVHAVYERLPRPGAGTAVFSYVVPVAERRPEQVHRVAVAYDPDARRVAWEVDGEEVLALDRIGRRALPSAHLTRDDDGPDEDAFPAQLVAGLGLLAEKPCGQGIRLTARRLEVRQGRRPAA